MQSDDIRGSRAQERFRMATARIVDPHTAKSQGLILLTWPGWAVIVIISLLLTMVLGLTVAVYLTSLKINQLEIQVDERRTSQDPN